MYFGYHLSVLACLGRVTCIHVPVLWCAGAQNTTQRVVLQARQLGGFRRLVVWQIWMSCTGEMPQKWMLACDFTCKRLHTRLSNRHSCGSLTASVYFMRTATLQIRKQLVPWLGLGMQMKVKVDTQALVHCQSRGSCMQ